MDTTVKAPAVSGDQREYLFDNYKVLLILLVVIGHFIEPSNDQNSFLYEFKMGNRWHSTCLLSSLSPDIFQADPVLKENALRTGHSLFCIRDPVLSFIYVCSGQRDRVLFCQTEIFSLVSDGTVRLETVLSSG